MKVFVRLDRFKYRVGIKKMKKRKKRYNNKRVRSRIKVTFIFILITVSVTYLFSSINNRINPLVAEMSVSSLSSMVLRECNSAVSEIIADENICYDKIIEKNTDSGGNLKSLSVNYNNLNLFKSELAVNIQNRIDKINDVEVYVPFMALFSNRFYSALGFPIKIKTLTNENVVIEFKDEFVSAGVNQTKHLISVIIRTAVAVNLPIMQEGDDIITEIPIAETIIVGGVPDTYLDFN